MLADLRARFETLTMREREGMGMVVAGRLNKQIAGEVIVKVHRGQVMRKMRQFVARPGPHGRQAEARIGRRVSEPTVRSGRGLVLYLDTWALTTAARPPQPGSR